MKSDRPSRLRSYFDFSRSKRVLNVPLFHGLSREALALSKGLKIDPVFSQAIDRGSQTCRDGWRALPRQITALSGHEKILVPKQRAPKFLESKSGCFFLYQWDIPHKFSQDSAGKAAGYQPRAAPGRGGRPKRR